MKKWIIAVCIGIWMFSATACGGNDIAPLVPENDIPEEKEKESEMTKLEIMVKDKTFTAVLFDNEASQALLEKLPMTISMNELNRNEKYYYFSDSFPTDSSVPSQIHAGDLMLFGSDCLVLFYDSFSTGYSYTPIGSIEDVSGLYDALGSGNVEVSFAVE